MIVRPFAGIVASIVIEKRLKQRVKRLVFPGKALGHVPNRFRVIADNLRDLMDRE